VSDSGYRRILVATDFSPCADAALAQAVWIARQAKGELVVAHVVADLRGAVHKTSYRSRLEFLEGQEEHFQRELRRESDEKLKRLIHALGDTDVKIKYETLLGRPSLELIHSVQQEGYDLVVAGTRGTGTWQQLFLGSTARQLIRKCPASVWIVKRKAAKPPASIVAAVDLSDVSGQALAQAAWLASCSGAELHLAHVVEHHLPEHMLDLQSANAPNRSVREWIEQEEMQNFEKHLRAIEHPKISVRRHLLWGNPGQQIVKLAKEAHADVIALGTVGRSGMPGLLLGNTAENILLHSDCDVLTVKPAGFQSPVPPASWPLHPGPEKH